MMASNADLPSAGQPRIGLVSDASRFRMWDNRTMSRDGVGTQADLGRRIADARTEAGMTQADLAARIGLERTALVRVESGERRFPRRN